MGGTASPGHAACGRMSIRHDRISCEPLTVRQARLGLDSGRRGWAGVEPPFHSYHETCMLFGDDADRCITRMLAAVRRGVGGTADRRPYADVRKRRPLTDTVASVRRGCRAKPTLADVAARYVRRHCVERQTRLPVGRQIVTLTSSRTNGRTRSDRTTGHHHRTPSGRPHHGERAGSLSSMCRSAAGTHKPMTPARRGGGERRSDT